MKASSFINQQAKQRTRLIYNIPKSFAKGVDLQGMSKLQIKREINQKILNKRVKLFNETWKEHTPSTRFNHATKDGKLIMQAANPMIKSFTSKNNPMYGINMKGAYKQLGDLLQDTTPKSRIVKAINKIIKSPSTDDHVRMQMQRLKAEINKKNLNSEDLSMKLSRLETSTDWYEENKEELQRMSEIRNKMLTENKKRVSGRLLEEYMDLQAAVGTKYGQRDIDIIDNNMFTKTGNLNVNAYREKANALGSTAEDVIKNVMGR